MSGRCCNNRFVSDRLSFSHGHTLFGQQIAPGVFLGIVVIVLQVATLVKLFFLP